MYYSDINVELIKLFTYLITKYNFTHQCLPLFFTDFVLVAVILISRKFKMNPDNLATPFAASIGDIVSLSVLSFIASILYDNLGKLIKLILSKISKIIVNSQ